MDVMLRPAYLIKTLQMIKEIKATINFVKEHFRKENDYEYMSEYKGEKSRTLDIRNSQCVLCQIHVIQIVA